METITVKTKTSPRTWPTLPQSKYDALDQMHEMICDIVEKSPFKKLPEVTGDIIPDSENEFVLTSHCDEVVITVEETSSLGRAKFRYWLSVGETDFDFGGRKFECCKRFITESFNSKINCVNL